MPTIRTHEICAEGLTSHLVTVMAAAFGVKEGTVRAWRSAKESETDPTGTGKRNPLDQAGRYITIVHRYNPGNARQAAEYFADLVDELDHAAGEAPDSGSILAKLSRLIKEGSDVATALMGGPFTVKVLRHTLREIAEQRASLEVLEAGCKAKLAEFEAATT